MPSWAGCRGCRTLASLGLVAHVQAMFDAIAASSPATAAARHSATAAVSAGVAGVRTMSPATLHRIRATLRKALNDAMRSVFFSVSLVVTILAVTPWDYVWKRYVSASGAPWR